MTMYRCAYAYPLPPTPAHLNPPDIPIRIRIPIPVPTPTPIPNPKSQENDSADDAPDESKLYYETLLPLGVTLDTYLVIYRTRYHKMMLMMITVMKMMPVIVNNNNIVHSRSRGVANLPLPSCAPTDISAGIVVVWIQVRSIR